MGLPISLFAAILIAAVPSAAWDPATDAEGALWGQFALALGLGALGNLAAGRLAVWASRRYRDDVHRLSRAYWLLLIAGHACALASFAWVCWYGRWPAWVNGPGLGGAPETVRFAALLAPYALAAAGRRAGFRAVRRQSRPAPASRRDVRLTSLLMVPLIGLLVFLDVLQAVPGVRDALRTFPSLAWLLLAVPGLLLLLGAPYLLRLAWPTRPVAPGPLREVLEDVCDRAQFRCADLRLWETSSQGMLNAAVTGILERWRSIFLTVPLVRKLPQAALEAVLAHEIAHVKRRHLLTYTVLGGGFICWLLAVEDYAARAYGADSEWYLGALGALALVWWGLGFGVMSRAFERQADLDGAANVGDPEAMVHALERVAEISGQPARKRAWRHGSIASRVAAVRAAAADPAVLARFHRRARALAATAPVLAVAGVLLLVPPLRVEYALGRARLAASRGAIASARIWYERAVRIRPPDVFVHESFGDICEEIGRPAEARAAYQRARAVAMTDADVRRLTERIEEENGSSKNP